MSIVAPPIRPSRRRFRPRRALAEIGAVALGIAVLIWSLLPIYNMLLVALDASEGTIEFSGNIWPAVPSLAGFWGALSEHARYLEHFWRQFTNSVYIGVATMLLTLLIGSLASFAVGRMRLSRGTWLTNAALLTYTVPASFLIFPFYKIMFGYGLEDNLVAVIAAQVTFAVPFAILIMVQYGKLLPVELDEAARLDGASAAQIYWRIYLPLMVPALAIIAIYSLLLAWNDYLYQMVLLSSVRNVTLSMTQAQLFGDTDPPWNAMMASAILYILPPVALFFGLRRHIAASLTVGALIG
jgi:multiple sugar transport system permease protein